MFRSISIFLLLIPLFLLVSNTFAFWSETLDFVNRNFRPDILINIGYNDYEVDWKNGQHNNHSCGHLGYNVNIRFVYLDRLVPFVQVEGQKRFYSKADDKWRSGRFQLSLGTKFHHTEKLTYGSKLSYEKLSLPNAPGGLEDELGDWNLDVFGYYKFIRWKDRYFRGRFQAGLSVPEDENLSEISLGHHQGFGIELFIPDDEDGEYLISLNFLRKKLWTEDFDISGRSYFLLIGKRF